MDARRRRRNVATALSALLLPRLALATVWTVSPPGGGGQFNDVQSAVNAASPGDTVLVLAGTYSPFVLDKALRVLGVGPGLVTVSVSAVSSPPPPAVVQVTGIPAGSFALLAGMTVQILTPYPPGFICFGPPFGWPSAAAVSAENCAGAVALSNLQIDPGLYFHGVRASASTAVLLDHVVVAAPQPPPCGPSISCGVLQTCVRPGVSASSTNLSLNDSSVLGVFSSTALEVEGVSQSLLARTNLTGADGASQGCFALPILKWSGMQGGHGLSATGGAEVRVAGGVPVTIRGGAGGPGYGCNTPTCCPGGNGGHAVTSSATVLLDPGLSLVPGSGYAAPCCPGTPGQAIVGSGVTISPALLPSLGVTPALSSPGGTITLEVRGAPSSPFALGASAAPGFLALPGAGPLLLDPGSLALVASGTLNTTGTATISVPVPPDPLLSTLVLFLQPATFLGPFLSALGPAVPVVIL